MLNELPLLIIREIVLRFDDFNLLVLFKLLNKRLNNFITRDEICQTVYLKLKYRLKIDRSGQVKNLRFLINLLNSKKYSKFFKTGFVYDRKYIVFVRPTDDSFIVFSIEETRSGLKYIFRTSAKYMTLNLIKLYKNKIRNFENYLSLKGFFHLNVNISLQFEDLRRKSSSKALPVIDKKTRECFSCILKYDQEFNQKLLEIVNDL